MQKIVINRNTSGQRFDKFLKKYFSAAPSSILYKMLRKKNITLNGKKADGSELLQTGDVVECFFADETFRKFHISTQEPGKQSLYEAAYSRIKGASIIYEDSDILAINKPFNVLSQQAAPNDLSINEWMIGYLLDSGQISREELRSFKPSVANRLDRNTSGIVLCGKSLKGSQILSEALKSRNLEKYYLAVCCGTCSEEKEITGFIVKDEATNKVRFYPANTLDTPDGAEEIHTSVYPLMNSRGYSLVKIDLHTGKTHQIRISLASCNLPILGDMKYGISGNRIAGEIFTKRDMPRRQLLHATKVVLTPDIADGQTIIAPLPSDFATVVDLLFPKFELSMI